MFQAEFDDIRRMIQARRDKILSDPAKKRTAGSEDRLAQFKKLAQIHDTYASEELMHLCSKHFLDLVTMANGTHDKYEDEDYFIELICDVMNYMDLLAGLIKGDTNG